MHFDFTTPIKALKSHQAMTKREREEQEKEDEIVEEKKKTDFPFSFYIVYIGDQDTISLTSFL